jgi:hypothetical protein
VTKHGGKHPIKGGWGSPTKEASPHGRGRVGWPPHGHPLSTKPGQQSTKGYAQGSDEDMTPTDTIIDYKVHLFLHLYSNFGYNSLGSTCTCRYLNVGINVSQSASPSKLNFRFVGSPIVFHWEGHNSSIRSAIEVNEHLMERLFDNISNRYGLTLISHCQGLQIIETFCRYFCRVLQRRRMFVIHT